ncbi:MAG: transposase [Clostridiales bacterium]|nr:transposase [Clostridiales bacterium]
MSSNNSKYSQEMRARTAKHILDSGKSATSMAEELGIDTNTVCRWVREYRRKNNLPSYAEEKGMKRKASKSNNELILRVR